MEVTVKPGQTLWDVAIASKGSWEAGIDMALSSGVSMTDIPKSGTSFSVPSRTYDRAMERYANTHNLDPATAGEPSTSTSRIFTPPFSEVFS